MYRTQTLPNDIVFQELLWYANPDIDIKRIAGIVSQGFEKEDKTEPANIYRELANENISLREFYKRNKFLIK